MRKNKYFRDATITVKVTEEEGLSVKATGSKELTVTSNAPISADAITVSRGTTAVSIADRKTTGNTIVLTVNGKLTAGTYTVKIGEQTASCEVEDEYVKEIVITDEDSYVAVSSDSKSVYVYYDVLNQYGESIRNTVTINWNTSLNNPSDDRVNGCVTLSSTNALIYGSTVYITGVYSKGSNVVTKQANVLVGLEAKADTVEFAGIVKKNTTAFTNLPVSFPGRTYMLAFTVKDQYGHPYPYRNNSIDVREEITFTSNSPLLLSIDKENCSDVTIDGTTYTTAWVQPGTYAQNGGTAQISAISGKTGKVTTIEITVGADQVLTTFTMSTPSDIISEGRTVEIPFNALDQNGNSITDYRVLKENLTVNASKGLLRMKEMNDGSAKLLYTAEKTYTSDEIDDYVTITSVVTMSGSFDSQTLYIKDRAYPVSIKSVGGSTTLLEGASVKIVNSYNTSTPYFTYVDQYGRDMVESSTSTDVTGDITAYFAKGHAIKAEYTGNYFTLSGAAIAGDVKIASGKAIGVSAVTRSAVEKDIVNGTITYTLIKTGTNEEIAGSSKKVNYTLVDLSKVVSFKADDLGTVYGNNANGITDTTTSWLDQQSGVSVKGYLSDGTEVTVPYVYSPGEYYYTVSVAAISGYTDLVTHDAITINTGAAVEAAANYNVPTMVVNCSGITEENLFKDPYSAGKPYRNEQFRLIVTINDVKNDGAQKDEVRQVVSVGKYAPVVSNFVGAKPAKLTVNPTDGTITGAAINFDSQLYLFTTDQYGKIVLTSPTITFSKVVENENNARKKNIQVVSNASTDAQITGAEIGDTFTVTYSAGNASISVDVTVGADTTAFFTQANSDGLY